MIKSRVQLEQEESKNLAPYAMKSVESAGRIHDEPDDPYRLPFQRDRDRIIHCRAFRRLQAKTQVFVSYYGDHYRDRLTHSMEVSQIARDLARTLGLNEDLSECLALAHDLGHPPFGHGGESALNDAMEKYGLHFEHNEQSRRIIEKLERIYPHFDGLNATREVLDGLLKHNPHRYHTYLKFEVSPHLESQVADLSDEIAYINHDIDDGLRSGIISLDQVRQLDLWAAAEKSVKKDYGDIEEGRRFISRVMSRMIRHMITDLQETAERNIQKHGIDSIEKVRKHKDKILAFSADLKPELEELRSFLLHHFYNHEKVGMQIEKGKKIIRDLFEYYREDPARLPQMYGKLIEGGEPLDVVVKDYVSGMTDHFAEETHAKIK
ncbi:MAG TPA: deoxyguanosinetriphosphate triphosphohydrolase [Candidatus Gracilibacteria bacterium]|nr:deoxyguanosinetriphosphate triphosphohydrolase [Candidatus Gracilibacteria bacterium]